MQTFRKKERLYNDKEIKELISKGENLNMWPFKIVWQQTYPERIFPVKVLITVPKKKFSKATDRNRIKRLIKEVYRKNKNFLYDYLNQNHININLMIIFYGDKILSYQEFELKIILILQRLIDVYEKRSG